MVHRPLAMSFVLTIAVCLLGCSSPRASGRARVRRCGDPPEEVAPVALGPCDAHVAGFDLHAGLVTSVGRADEGPRTALC
jgi:hypothetical protein